MNIDNIRSDLLSELEEMEQVDPDVFSINDNNALKAAYHESLKAQYILETELKKRDRIAESVLRGEVSLDVLIGG
jgi:hypothetical protein